MILAFTHLMVQRGRREGIVKKLKKQSVCKEDIQLKSKEKRE